MNEEIDRNDEDEFNDGSSEPEIISIPSVSARVPPGIGIGVFSTGAIVTNATNEVIVDFIQQHTPHGQIVARVVLPHRVAAQFVATLAESLDKFKKKREVVPQDGRHQHSAPRTQPSSSAQGVEAQPPDGSDRVSEQDIYSAPRTQASSSAQGVEAQPPDGSDRVSAQDIYSELDIPVELACGSYANSVLIRNNETEFVFDFVAKFYPFACVSNRIFMVPSRVHSLLDALKRNIGEC